MCKINTIFFLYLILRTWLYYLINKNRCKHIPEELLNLIYLKELLLLYLFSRTWL